MYQSLKPNVLATRHDDLDLEECLDRVAELEKVPNFSSTKTKKIADSYYYKLETKNRDKLNPKNSKHKDNVTQPKMHRPSNYKQSKSKLIPHRKTSKSKQDQKEQKLGSNSVHSNHQSLKRLISST